MAQQVITSLGVSAPTTGTNRYIRRYKSALKQAYIHTAQWWFRERMPRHFTAEGGQEYGYEPRTPGYMRKKRRRRHTDDPLVWTGESRRKIKQIEDIKGNSSGATVRLNVPRHWNWHPHHTAELLATTQREVRNMGRQVQRFVTSEMNRMPKKVIRVKT